MFISLSKIIFFTLIFLFAINGQEQLFEDEIIIHVFNSNTVGVDFIAERLLTQGGKWAPYSSFGIHGGQLTGSILDAVNFHAPHEQYAEIDLEGDQNPQNTISLSTYKFSKNGPNDNYFYIYSVLYDIPYGFNDVDITYDYATDRYFFGNCPGNVLNCAGEIQKGSIIIPFNNYFTGGLENYWSKALFIPFDQTDDNLNYSITLLWGPHNFISPVSYYEISRAFGNISGVEPNTNDFQIIGHANQNIFTFHDKSLKLDDDPTSFAWYYIKAINSYQQSSPTNKVWVPILVEWNTTLCINNLYTNPILVWGPHPNTTYNNGFNVYRAVVSPGQPEPAEGNFALLTPNGLSASTFTYTDGDINLGTNNNSLVYYFVKAKGNGSTLSAKTNTVDIDGRYIEIEKEKGNEEIEINNFSLSQNHPNPFNPTTTIVYQTPIAGIVNLSVYNLLGEKIATPVNDYKEAGEYTLQFNASGLPSGTYIYTLTTKGKKISKKLSVMK